ncbi:(d)CMP kinase [bacterium]|nr:(d)CMP kinase [bacterium]
MIITIDGPAASGKSSLAQYLAKDLGFIYLSSGMIFRAIAYVLKNNFGYVVETIDNVSEDELDQIFNLNAFSYVFNSKDGSIKISFREKDVTPYLKLKEMDEYSSLLGKHQMTRKFIKKLLHDFVENENVVVEGRDMGSAVFPDADFKFYLTAELDERAKRWREQQQQKGKIYTQKEAKKIVFDRDERDKNRKIDPLCIPKNAVIIDNTNLKPYQTVDKIKSFLPFLKN